MRDLPEYSVWKSMRTRVRNPSNSSYKNYGGRGITLSPQWDSFAQFIKDMGPRPTAAHTLERLDTNKGYCPENCVWETRLQQGRNKRSSTVRHWELMDRYNMTKSQIHARIRVGRLYLQGKEVPRNLEGLVTQGAAIVLAEGLSW